MGLIRKAGLSTLNGLDRLMSIGSCRSPQWIVLSRIMSKSLKRTLLLSSQLAQSLRSAILIRVQQFSMCKEWYAFTNWSEVYFKCCNNTVSNLRQTHFQGMKQFSKAARDLIGMLQKIDGDNYPEVIPLIFKQYLCMHFGQHFFVKKYFSYHIRFLGPRRCAGCSSLMQARDSGFYGAQ